MVERVESIVEQALVLTESDRTAIIRRLLDSLDGAPKDGAGQASGHAQAQGDSFFSSPEIEQAWAEEIQRRVEEMDRGEMKFTPGHEVVARIREQLRRTRDA